MSEIRVKSREINVSATLDNVQYQDYAYNFRKQIITMGLFWGMYGILTSLSILSVYALTRQSRRKRLTIITLCFTILALFTSTTIFMVTSIIQGYSYFLQSLVDAADNLWSYSPDIAISRNGVPSGADFNLAPSLVEACTSAATLTVNVLLGDAIVCWRACVIWHNNRVVRSLCGLLLLATLGLGATNAIQSCHQHPDDLSDGITITTARTSGPVSLAGTLFKGLPLGIATCVLSLGTNVFATLLVAYKAWESRRRLRGYFTAKVGGSRVEKLLSLLIESGAIYSAIWAVIVAYQVGQFKYGYKTTMFSDTGLDSREIGPEDGSGHPESATESSFLDIFGIMMNGTLVPMIAIYPTVIIVLVALNSSHMERGFTQHLESLPTPHIAHMHRRSEALVIDEQPQESRCGDVSDESDSESEDASGCTSEERKGQEIA